MSKTLKEHFETLGQAAERLLCRLERTAKNKASERLEGSEQIGTVELPKSRFPSKDYGDNGANSARPPAVDDVTAPEDRAATGAIRRVTLHSKSDMRASPLHSRERVRPLPRVLYVSWAGVAIIGSNDNHRIRSATSAK
jgi:hypothetical protein